MRQTWFQVYKYTDSIQADIGDNPNHLSETFHSLGIFLNYYYKKWKVLFTTYIGNIQFLFN